MIVIITIRYHPTCICQSGCTIADAKREGREELLPPKPRMEKTSSNGLATDEETLMQFLKAVEEWKARQYDNIGKL